MLLFIDTAKVKIFLYLTKILMKKMSFHNLSAYHV